MQTSKAVTTIQGAQQPRSVTIDMAHRFGMEPAAFEATLRATVVPGNCSKEQFAAFLLVAKQYDLNPITKEIFAFPAGGGIQPIVSVDGWMSLINRHESMDGLEFEDQIDESGKIIAITARIYRKDRSKPVSVTEYMVECVRNTPTWKQWPARMLRHKAAIQAARYAFGFSGIMEPDEYERQIESQPLNASQAKKAGLWPDLMAALDACQTMDDLDAFHDANAPQIKKLNSQWAEQLSEAVEKRVEAIAAAEEVDRALERELAAHV